MRHLTISTALLAGCLIAGAAWAQGSSGGSSGGSTGGASGGSAASPSTGSSASPSGGAQSGGSTIRPPAQGAQGGTNPSDNTAPGNRASGIGGTTGNTANTGPIRPPGSEGSTGGANTSSNSSSTDPATTGGVSGNNRLQPGERSAVGPSSREEELLRQGEQVEQKARRGICQGC
jgi:hypothetical protein